MLQSPRHVAQSHSSPIVTRRTALRALTGMGVLLALSPHRSLAQRSPIASPALMVGETFVGRTSDPTLFIAIVLRDQHAMAYLCNGSLNRRSGWFEGAVIDDQLDVTATDGARLVGLRAGIGISGGGLLPDGRDISFLAEPAAGFGGLYAVHVHADGRIHGDTSTHSVLDGTVMRSSSTQQPVETGARFAAQLTLPDGHQLPVEVWTASADPGQYWVIVLADGAARGDGIAIISGMGLRAVFNRPRCEAIGGCDVSNAVLGPPHRDHAGRER